MNILFLDDSRNRCHLFRCIFPSADIVETAEEAIGFMEHKGPYDIVCLDHDLGGEQFANERGKNTGSEVVRQMITKNLVTKHVVVHSFNGPAAIRMTHALMEHGYTVWKHNFGPHMLDVVQDIIDKLEQNIVCDN